MILAKHLSRVVFLRILAVALVLGGLALALDLVESAAVVLDAGDGGMARYISLRAPLILTVVLPVALIPHLGLPQHCKDLQWVRV